MKIFIAILDFVALVTAFATINPDLLGGKLSARQEVPDNNPTFDATAQYVSVDGDHTWQAPNLDGGDQRGPCPGLNAAANHGYLPRSGVANHAQFIDGTFKVFGMNQDLSGFLTILGALLDGDGVSRWSIGGPSRELPGLPPLLGQPQGISASHNRYECDVSPARGDLYTHGDAFSVQMDQYQQMYDMAIANGDNLDMTTLNKFRSERFDQSVNENPYFFNGPFSGVAVQPAAFYFIYRFMGNKSAEYPAGRLNTEILNSFYGVERQADGTLKHTPGHERIPNNFYKRAIGNEYSIPFFIGDVIAGARAYPKFISIGGNQGRPNSFAGVNLGDLMGGISNVPDLLQPANLACFIQQIVIQATPDSITCSGVVGGLASALSDLTSQLQESFGDLFCSNLGRLSTEQFEKFPGYSELNCKDGLYS